MENIIKKNYKFIISLIVMLLLFSVEFPYYIDAPGGIDDVSKKIYVDGYDSKGSFNLAYVKEYRATLPTLIISLFNKEWNVIKEKDILLDSEDDEAYYNRDKIFMDESINNAIKVAYEYADKSIETISSKLKVSYIDKNFNTSLIIGDEIVSINDIVVYNRKDIENIISNLNFGDKLNIKVTNKNKNYDRYAYVINDNGLKKIGIILNNIYKYKTDPEITIKTDKNESGPSGGLMIALSIYNSLIKQDITHGYKIVGTGTIDLEGNIGSIGGVEYKLKSAVKENADIFIVPNEENLEEALKLKKKNNYNIKIIGVSTFSETVERLKKLK